MLATKPLFLTPERPYLFSCNGLMGNPTHNEQDGDVTGISRVEKMVLINRGNVNGDWYPTGTTVYALSIWVRDADDMIVL